MTQRTKSRLRIAGVAALLVAVAAAVYLGFTQGRVEATETAEPKDATGTAEGDAPATVPVEVTVVTTGPVASYLSATANLVPEDEVRVLAEAEGRVATLAVEEGDRVARGQVLASLVRDEAEIALAKARVRERNAEQALERARGTMDKGLISREEFDRLSMEHEVARQEVAEAEWRLSRTVIRAPFAGVVTERMITAGQHLQPGDQAFAVADFDPLIARIYLPEKDVLALEPGREVRISLAADPTQRVAGRIRQISPVVDTATGTVKLTVEAVDPPPALRPGAFVSVQIVREQRQAAVLLPRESVIRELRTAHVFITDGEIAEKRPVTLGLEEGEVIEAVSGVTAGEKVIVAGQGGLKPGAKVRVL